MGELGGRQNRRALERLLARYALSKKTFVTAERFSERAQSAASVARDVLQLDPESTRAADLLVRLFAHPNAYNRMFSTWQAAAIVADAQHRNLHTVAVDRLTAGIRGALHAEDAVFIKALPALFSLWPEQTEVDPDFRTSG